MGARALLGAVDLRALQRGGEGRGGEVGEGNWERRSAKSAHEFLPEFQESGAAEESDGGADRRCQTVAFEEPRLASVQPGEEAWLGE